MKKFLFILLGLSISTFATSAELNQINVSGKVNYTKNIELPKNAVFEVRLIDVTIQDVKHKVVSEQSMKVTSQPAFYHLPFDPKYVNPSNDYEVEASITVDGKSWFLNTSAHPAFTTKTQDRVDLNLDFVK